MRIILFFILLLWSQSALFAQQCAVPDHHQGKPAAAMERTPPVGKITIPVVVHIVWKQDAENISDAQVESQIAALNRDFQQLNDQSNVTPDFRPLIANVGLEFCLAKIDPKGRATSGITRTQTSYDNVWSQKGTTQSNLTPRRRIYHGILEGHDAWDTTRYLNIWVGKLGNGKLGYSTFPTGRKSDEIDGIVIDPFYFGTIGTATQNTNFSLGRTATHEVGHYLNLMHPWGNLVSNFDCSGDDGVGDTPQQEEAVTGCPSSFVFHCGKKVMTMNFMNFAHDQCMTMFTLGQKERMLNALMTYRVGLINSAACNPINSNDNILINNILAYPNPMKNELNIDLKQYSNINYIITDLAGKVMLAGILEEGKNQIEVQDFPKGIYIFGASHDKNSTYIKLSKL